MKARVIYKVYDTEFERTVTSATELFDSVRSIIRREYNMFPDQKNTMDEYMRICANIAFSKSISHENHIFKIERIPSDDD